MGDFNTEAQRHRGGVAESRDAVGSRVPRDRDEPVGLARRASRVRLGDVCQEISVRNRDCAISSVCSVTNSRGFIASTDYFNKEVFSKDLTSYKVVAPSMFAYNPSRINVGSVACWRGNHPVVVSPLYVVFKVDDNIVELSVLEKFLRSEIALRQIRALTSGSVRDSLKFSALCKIEIPLPPLATQHRIAAVLDQICEMKRNAETRLAKLDLLVKSRFVEMFGDPFANPRSWDEAILSDHVEFLTSGSRGWAKYYSDEGELFITIKNVKNSRVNIEDVQHITPPQGAEAERTRVKEGDLLISITADLGRTGVVTKEIADRGAYINQHLTRISLKRDTVDPLFLAFYMETSAGKAQFAKKNQSAVKAGLNFDAIKSLKFYLPPLPLQREFAAFVAEIDKLELTVRQEIEKVDLLYRAKLQEYFG